MNKMVNLPGVFLLILALAGCGGAKVLKEPQPLVVTEALTTATDQRLAATLDWVIYRDGPGTWAKNVDWDEYVLSIRNLGADSLQVTNISVVDALGTWMDPRQSRRQLVKGTKETRRRFKGEGLEVKAGLGTGTLLAAGAATAASGVAIVGAAGVFSSTAAVAATGTVILVPVFAVGGVLRGVNNSKVSKQIEARQTLLPIVLRQDEEKTVHIFFSLAPSPRQIEVTYANSRGDRTLIIDTQAALDGLHLARAE